MVRHTANLWGLAIFVTGGQKRSKYLFINTYL